MFGPSEILIWFVDYLFAFRAAPGLLDATMDLYKVMISSFQLNPNWYAAFKSIAQYMAQRQIQHIQHVGQIGQMLAQTGSQMRQQNLNDWYARQQVYDRVSTDVEPPIAWSGRLSRSAPPGSSGTALRLRSGLGERPG